ncbi:MFS transporter [Streptacidiphilus jiangxiensis]|uniref:MFS-type transporter involved in bile tolerance, Atg22 family n=1 Tax=Streptacidiphilus jiangxiensis TaxID=235985 RepID=A0A1H7VNF2_STRJI|nr:MFS transporter [Streptacidiphilus jiangxiensis]SEM10375.1 MFS-type transporter involved in bile tolerance, Atg22 family [Streptacidiphilus jiangxiensis]
MSGTMTLRPLRDRIARAVPPPGPIRVLQTNTLIGSTGYGLYTSGSALFFVKVAGLSAAQVGLGFSLGGLAGLLLSVRVGRLADRLGPREVFLGFCALQIALLATASSVRSFVAFLPVIVGLGCTETGLNVARGAVTGSILPKEDRVRLSAITRVLTNIGFSLGVLLAGTAIGVGTRAAYSSLVLGMAVTTFLVALSILRLPRIAPTTAARTPGGPRERFRYDLPYMAVSFVSSTTLIGNTVLTVGLPLWIVTETSIPRPLAAWMILGNTALVILLQVRVAKGSETTAGAARMQRGAFAVLALACVAAAATRGSATPVAVGALLLCVALLTLGELWGESANWAFRYGFADPERQGAYSGMFVLSGSLPTAAAPVLVTFVTTRFLLGGWLALAGLFLAGLVVNAPVVGWAERTRGSRPAAGEEPAPQQQESGSACLVGTAEEGRD